MAVPSAALGRLPSLLCLPPNRRRRRKLPRRILKANRPPSSSFFWRGATAKNSANTRLVSSAKGVPRMENTPCYVF